MGTEVFLSINSLRSQLENERSSLYKIDESIKKIVQTPRFQSDRFNACGDFGRNVPRLGNRNSFPESGTNTIKNDELFGKRKHETKTVFSRLSARAEESDGEQERSDHKRTRMSSAVSRELPSRADVLRAQGGDEAARGRNRRMFGSLLGTLHKFKQEEIGLQNKEEKKAQVERKIEEQERQKKEVAYKERKSLFAEREHKKEKIKTLEVKVARLSEFQRWETSQRTLGNFILTKSKPSIYWLPRKMEENAETLLTTSRTTHDDVMQAKHNNLQEYLTRIEQICARRRHHHNQTQQQDQQPDQQPDGHKRDYDKEREDSDEADAVDAIADELETDISMQEPGGVNGNQETSIKQEEKMETTDELPQSENLQVVLQPTEPTERTEPSHREQDPNTDQQPPEATES